ncbi:MAG: electron transport complex subunit RsxC [Oscillospiraceae bacterium]|jgi:electron transport complex protein RnfC|nr:electron transport complex subunit RsxC [Oscillospiraceae bacterium]
MKQIPHDVFRAVRRIHGGVPVPHQKNTAGCEITRIPTPTQVMLSMRQHIGAPCAPIVKVGERVTVGQKIADTDAFVSAPIHASVSGTVTAIGEHLLPNSIRAGVITIESDGLMTLCPEIAPPIVQNTADFLKAVRESGLVGLGGAGFPTHVKLTVPPEKHVDTLIINAAECEPYITVDYRECLDQSRDLLRGVYLLLEQFNFKRIIIAVEDNKTDVFYHLQKIAQDVRDRTHAVQLMTLKSRYPQGAEKLMIWAALGRKVPVGALPADTGCMVLNVTTVSTLYRYFKTGKPLVSRSLTVDGSAVAEPKNVRAPIGTSVRDILDFCGGLTTEEPYKIIAGGPMMGFALPHADFPTLKQNNAILAFAQGEKFVKPERNCLHCGRCNRACPLSLMPAKAEGALQLGDIDTLRRIGTETCMECGCCAYTCPAGKPLVQHMRLAKEHIQKEATKA